MAMEWLPTDEAARTLGVDVDALQAWIDDGRAPTRTHDGQLQVLIEFTDEDDAAESAAASGEGPDERETVVIDDADPTEPTDSRVTVVDERQLQLAGGMVAAWQRVAESADLELARSRKLGVAAWSTVGVLAVAGAVGLWSAGRAVSDAEADRDLAKYQNEQLAGQVETAGGRVSQLETQIAALRTEAADTQAKLTDAVEKAALAAGQVDKVTEQNRLLTEAGQRQSELNDEVVSALRSRIEEQAKRITTLEQAVADGAEQLGKLNERLAEAQRQLTDTLKQLRETDARLADADRKLSLGRDAAADLARQRDAAAGRADSASAQRDKLEEANTKLQADLQAERERIVSDRAALQTKLDEQLKQTESLLSQVQQHQAKVKSLESSLAAAKADAAKPAAPKSSPPAKPKAKPAPESDSKKPNPAAKAAQADPS